MTTKWNGNGTLVSPTSGASVRVPIASSTNASPIVVTTSIAHGFNTGDTIEIEGHATNTAANGQWQITKQGGSTFALNNSTGNGVGGATGYAIDYELLPGYSMIGNGSLADANDVVAMGEGLSNTSPFSYRRAGKWRLYNQYALTNDWITTPFSTNPWSTNSPFSSSVAVALASSTVTLESMSDTTSIPPVFVSGDLLEFNMTLTAGAQTLSASPQGNIHVGFGIIQGASLLSTIGMPSALVPVNYTFGTVLMVPIGLNGTLVIGNAFSLPASNLSICVFGRVDVLAGGTVSLDLFGQWNVFIKQYRLN